MEVTPDDGEAHHFRFACPCGKLEGVAAPGVFLFGNTQSLNFSSGSAKFSNDLRKTIDAPNFFQINQRFEGFSLAKVVAKFKFFTCGSRFAMSPLKPVVKQLNCGIAGTDIKRLSPFPHR
jgi:hypothetical protein